MDICPVQGLPQEREEEEEEEQEQEEQEQEEQEEVDTELTTLASKWFPAAIVRGKNDCLLAYCFVLHSALLCVQEFQTRSVIDM